MMTPVLERDDDGDQVAVWVLPSSATLGSSVRAKGIFQATRLRLPPNERKALTIRGTQLALKVSSIEAGAPSIGMVSKALEGIEARPVIPREIQDILGITATERRRWLKDGRLASSGTRTVRLNGRAKKITFQVFDPELVRDLLNRDAVMDWREEDAHAAAENKRRAAWARGLKRKQQSSSPASMGEESPEEAARHLLKGWAEFERDGLLR